jgi:hypothetical protein
MKQFSKELGDMLTDFIVSEIGSKGLSGVTYALKLKNEANREDIERFIRIREEADRCGYDSKELFRAYEVSNGYVFDMDLKAMTNILVKIARSAAVVTGKHKDKTELVYSEPEETRRKDIIRLARTVAVEYDKGNHGTNVALFNRNEAGFVNYMYKGEDGVARHYRIDAMKVRTYDIVTMNSGPLKDTGIVVRQVIPKYILPKENGLVTELVWEKRVR